MRPQIIQPADLELTLQTRLVDSLEGKRLLITGATGMLGSFLVETIFFGLREAGLESAHLDLLVRKGDHPNLSSLRDVKNVDFIETKLGDWSPRSDYDYVIHAASPASPTHYDDGEAVREANSGFIQSISSHPDRLGRVLFVSSGEVYGSQAQVPIYEEYSGNVDSESPRAIYPMQKLFTEQLLSERFSDSVVTRLFHSFGPGVRENDGRSFADFIWSAARGKEIQLRSRGDAIRTFLYSWDAVSGLLTALFNARPNSVVNVGSDQPMSIRCFASTVAELGGTTLNHEISASSSYIQSPNLIIVPSNERLRRLGWTPVVDLHDGILRTIAWARGKQLWDD